ncbi:MAG TPA: GNAT family N-acetyltransferase [Longilinea sp.]|nr:GNAT family N-acetyltransferase [Longilinea sp.]
MITYQPVANKQYDELLQLMREDAADYLQQSLDLMRITREEFGQLFRTIGQVDGIYQDEQLAGFYWIEERPPVLHLHALILKPTFQGKGIGTIVLQMLIATYGGRMQAIELGVHQSNPRAKKLYGRLGFVVIDFKEDLGYFIMQRPLAAIAING